MTELERCLAVLNGQLPDCVPVVPENYLFSIRHCGYRMKDVVRNGRLLADCLIKTCDDFGYDGVTVDLDNAVSAEILGCPVKFREDEPAIVEQPIVTDLADLDRLQLPQEKMPGRSNVYVECVSRLAGQIGRQKLITSYCDQGPFSLAALVRGIENFMFDLVDPEVKPQLHRLLGICAQITEMFGKLLIEAGAHVVVFGDALASPDVVSPAIYREFALPYERKVVSKMKGKGSYIGIHICGNVTAILPDLVTTGADLLDIDYKTDLYRVAELCRGKVVVRGPLDPSSVLYFGTPEVVKAKAKEAIEILGKRGGLLLGSGCDMSPDTPEENLQTMIRVAHDFRYEQPSSRNVSICKGGRTVMCCKMNA